MDGEFEWPSYTETMPKEVLECWEKLSERRKKFCIYYIQNGNGSKAARDAGYSEKGARVRSCEILANSNSAPVIKWLDEYVTQNSLDTSIVSKRQIQQKLSSMFTADQSEFLINGSKIDLQDAIESGAIVALAEITTHTTVRNHDEETEETTVKKIKLHDPVKIAAELNKMQGNYEPEQFNVNDSREKAKAVALDKLDVETLKKLRDATKS